MPPRVARAPWRAAAATAANGVTLALGLTAAFGWAVTDYFATRSTRQAGPLGTLFWLLSAGLLLALPVSLATSWHAPARDFGVAALAGVADVGAFGLFMLALSVGELAIVSPLVALSGGGAAVIGFASGARVGALTVVALVAAVIGGALASVGPGRRTAKGVPAALGSAIAGAAIFVLFSYIHHLGALQAVVVARVVSVALVAPVAIRRGALRLDRLATRLACVAGLLDAGAFVAFASAASRGPLPLAAVAGTQFAPLAALIGIVVFAERPTRHQLVGIALTVIAISTIAATQTS